VSNPSVARTYFKARLGETDSDFREWPDGFNFENIPSNLFDLSYHIVPSTIVSGPLDNCSIIDAANWEVRLFFKGFRDIQETIDAALDKAHTFRVASVKPTNAFTSDPNIKNVVLNTMAFDFPDGNDNAVIVVLNFTVTVYFSA